VSAVRVRARRGEGEKLREEILAAVSALLDETNDEAAVSIRAIAERVGVTPPSIYRHFADKDEMLGAVCADVFVQLTAGIAQAAASATSPIDALAGAGRCYVEFGLAHPEHYRLVFMRPPFTGHGDHSELRDALAAGEIPESDRLFGGDALAGSEAFKALYDLVDMMLAQLPAPTRPDVFTVTTSMWTAMHGITSLRISKPDFTWPPVEEQIDAVLWPWRLTVLGGHRIRTSAVSRPVR
jgi:AcrR family transcriptional regulator